MTTRSVAMSYRRDDSEAIAGRLFDRLSGYFGRETVFRDIESIAIGTDFRVQVEQALTACGVVVAVIGRNWRGPVRGGRTRIQEEIDPVRIEIEIALRQGIPIIPVLVGATKMPSPAQLPASLESLVFRHACRIDPGEDFDHHADRLIREIEKVVGPAVAGPAVAASPAAPPPSSPPREPDPPPPRTDVGAGRARSRDRAPDDIGGYARSSLSHYPGTYLVIRPAFRVRVNIYAYLVDISWDEENGGLVFQERSRSDTRHTQTGRIWIPSPSDYLYLVSGRDGWLRSVTLSFLDDRNEMRGIVSTLHNVRGARYVPVAAPIVFVKRDDAGAAALGELAPDDPSHAEYLAVIRRAVADEAAQLIAVT